LSAPRKIIRGLTTAEKKAFVFQCNFARRNLSVNQKEVAHEAMKAIARELRQENPKKNTQKVVARMLGVARETVRALRAENRELKKALRRKEQALAETAALLVLKKKAASIGFVHGEAKTEKKPGLGHVLEMPSQEANLLSQISAKNVEWKTEFMLIMTIILDRWIFNGFATSAI